MRGRDQLRTFDQRTRVGHGRHAASTPGFSPAGSRAREEGAVLLEEPRGRGRRRRRRGRDREPLDGCPRRSPRDTYSWIVIASGGLGAASSLLGLFRESSLEELSTWYAPIAADERRTADQRLREGEEGLRRAASHDAAARRVSGITTIVVGAALGGMAAWFATTPELSSSDRALLGAFTGVSSVLAIGAGVGLLWFEEGPAEIALEHWEAARGLRRQARVVPVVAPTPGGVMAGLSLEL